jgi:hypothetical protein
LRGRNSRNSRNSRILGRSDAVDVGLKETAGFLEDGHCGRRFAIVKIGGENQVVAAFLQRSLRDVQEANLVSLTSAFETLGYVRRNRDSRPAELAGKSVSLLARERTRQLIDSQRQIV